MVKLTATVEQAGDGTWTAAYMDAENLALGTGATREEALNDLRSGLAALIECLRVEGKTLPQSSREVVSIEVAA